MEQNYWLDRWQSSNIAFHQENINADLITFVNNLSINKGDCIFVPLCGKSLDMLWLMQQGYKVIGVELSQIACEAFFTENKLNVTVVEQQNLKHYKSQNIELICGDIFNVTPEILPPIKAIYDRAALIALLPQMRVQYAKQIIKIANNQARILLLCHETKDTVQGPPFPVDKAEVNSLFGKDFSVAELKREHKSTVSEHLIAKGYKEKTDTAYLLTPNTPQNPL